MTDPQPPGRRRFRITLTQLILVGFVLGCLIGWQAPGFAVQLGWIKDLFLRLIKMVIGPLLFTTLVAGIAGASGKMVVRLGIKALIWFELATTVALIVGLVAANLVQPGAGVTPSEGAGQSELGKLPSFVDFLVTAVPTSMFDAMAKNNVLQIVAFSMLFGLAVSAAGAKARVVRDIAEAGAEAMFKLVGFVMYVAPLGVGAAIAVTLGTYGISALVPLIKCVVALYGALIVFFVLLFLAMRLVTRVHLPSFFKAIREPAVIAFTTASSDAALPRAVQVLEQLGIPRRIVSFVVPTGYAFNLDGTTLYLSLAIVFVNQRAGVDMSWGTQLAAMLTLMIASKGVAGVPRAALVVLASIIPDAGPQSQGLLLLLGIDALMDAGRTCINVVGNCIAAVVVAAWERAIPASAPIFGPRAAPRPASPVSPDAPAPPPPEPAEVDASGAAG